MKERIIKFLIAGLACWILAPFIVVIIIIPVMLMVFLLPFVAIFYPDKIKIFEDNSFIKFEK